MRGPIPRCSSFAAGRSPLSDFCPTPPELPARRARVGQSGLARRRPPRNHRVSLLPPNVEQKIRRILAQSGWADPQVIGFQELLWIRECKRRNGTNRHKGEFLQISPWEALRIPKRLVEFKRPLVASRKVSKTVEFRSHRKAESKGKNSQLLKDLVVQSAECLTDEKPADSVFSRFSNSPA